MTTEIKNRITQIQNGEVPEGYKKTKVGIVPSEWEHTHFSTLFAEYSDYTSDEEKYPLYSLTIENGITAKSERYERSHLVKKENAYKVLPVNHFAFNPMNVRFGAVARHKANFDVSVSGYYDIFTTKLNSDLEFMDNYLTSYQMIQYYNKVSTGSLVEKQRVHFSQFLEFNLPLPNKKERKKIAEILTTQDKVIELKEKLIAEKEQQKKYFMQNLLTGKKRHKGFSGEWKKVELGDIFEYLQPTKYLVSDTNYNDKFITPVLTAGKTFILGYTNERENIFTDTPVVIFDDFTTSSKYVNFPFKAKSSAMKILKCTDKYNIVVAFQAMQQLNYVVGGHERHWISKFSQIPISLPPLPEQNAIAEILSTADREIELLKADLLEEKQKKKALMQLLLTGIVRV